MWEIIEKNKKKFAIAFIISTIWYMLVFGIFFAILIQPFSSTICRIELSFVGSHPINDIPFFLSLYLTYLNGCLIALFVFYIKFLLTKDKPYKIDGCKMYRASKTKNRQLYNIAEEICLASGLAKVPDIYIIDSTNLNAYACGITPEKSSIVITKSLIEYLSRDELQGVIAHEISHIVNGDTAYLLSSGLLFIIASGFNKILLSTTQYIEQTSGLVIILFPFMMLGIIGLGVCYVLFMFISRNKEYLADACAAQYTRYPRGLANALMKMSDPLAFFKIKNNDSKLYNKLVSENGLIYDANQLIKASFIIPLVDEKSKYEDAHPSTKNRAKVLLNMVSADYRAYEEEFKKLNNDTIIPKSALAKSKTIEIKKVEPEKIVDPAIAIACSIRTTSINIDILKENKELLEENIIKHRQVEDMVRDLAGYSVIKCDCGTILKVPPCYKNTIVICPHCKKKHSVV